ncbi:MAG: hypothetical protein QXE51_04220 [Nitrososphaeria archaeon]
MNRRRKKGFTGLELMLVMAIIASLITASVAVYNKIADKSVDSSVANQMKSIGAGIMVYKSRNGTYPAGNYAQMKQALIDNGILTLEDFNKVEKAVESYSYISDGKTFEFKTTYKNAAFTLTPGGFSVSGNATTSLQVTLSGPTSLTVKQQATYTANVVGGTAPYTYTWYNASSNTNSAVVSFEVPGTYIIGVSVKDAKGASSSTSITVVVSQQDNGGQNNNFTVSITASSYVVKVKQSVSFTAVVVGGTAPYTYVWTNAVGNSNTASQTFNTVGLYQVSVNVRDASNKSAVDSISILVVEDTFNNIPFQIAVNNAEPDVNEEITISFIVNGGTPPYTCIWSVTGSDVAYTSTFSSSVGTAKFKFNSSGPKVIFASLVDKQGNRGTASKSVTVYNPIQLNITSVPSSPLYLFENLQRALSINMSGGKPPYSVVVVKKGTSNLPSWATVYRYSSSFTILIDNTTLSALGTHRFVATVTDSRSYTKTIETGDVVVKGFTVESAPSSAIAVFHYDLSRNQYRIVAPTMQVVLRGYKPYSYTLDGGRTYTYYLSGNVSPLPSSCSIVSTFCGLSNGYASATPINISIPNVASSNAISSPFTASVAYTDATGQTVTLPTVITVYPPFSVKISPSGLILKNTSATFSVQIDAPVSVSSIYYSIATASGGYVPSSTVNGLTSYTYNFTSTGSYYVQVRVDTSIGQLWSNRLDFVVVDSVPTLSITPPSGITSFTKGTQYTFTMNVSGGSGTSWVPSVTSSDATISSVPSSITPSCSFPVNITWNTSGTKTITFSIIPMVNGSVLSSVQYSTTYQVTVKEPFTASVTVATPVRYGSYVLFSNITISNGVAPYTVQLKSYTVKYVTDTGRIVTSTYSSNSILYSGNNSVLTNVNSGVYVEGDAVSMQLTLQITDATGQTATVLTPWYGVY